MLDFDAVEWASCLALVPSLFFVVGCGGAPSDTPDLGRVTGTVTIDGKPTGGVTVMFSPVGEGRASSGVTDADGKYDLIYSTSAMGAIVGQHNVAISGASNMGAEDWEEEFSNSDVPAAKIPEDYLKVEKKFDVKSGTNEIDLVYP